MPQVVPTSAASVQVARATVEMPLQAGSSLSAIGTSAQGFGSPPVSLTFDSLTCSSTLPGVRQDVDKAGTSTQDAVADPGKQLCVMKLAVRNTSTEPVYFSSSNEVTLKASNGNKYGEDERISGGSAAAAAGVEYSGDTNFIQPGDTQYDFVVFQIPADAKPQSLVFTNMSVPVSTD